MDEVTLNVRHDNNSHHLEEQSKHVQGSRQKRADPRAKGQEAGEERADGEEEANQNEGEHEAGEQEEFVVPYKLLRYAICCIECSPAGGVQRVGGSDAVAEFTCAAAVAVAIVPKRPSCDRRGVGDARCVCLKEIDGVGGAGIDGAG